MTAPPVASGPVGSGPAASGRCAIERHYIVAVRALSRFARARRHPASSGLRRLLALLAVGLASVQPARAEEPERFPPGPTVPTGAQGDHRFALTPPTTTVLLRGDVAATAPLGLDALLAEIPSLSLLGRAPSVVADLPTQTLSLRGVGPGGTSRALVLVDGVPANDPFGGFVPWARIPVASVERVEVVRGSSPLVWGASTPGGLVHVVTRSPGARAGTVEASYGTRGTGTLGFSAADRVGPGGVRLDGAAFETGGFTVVRRDQRGPIDEDADARYLTLAPRLEYGLSASRSLSVSARFFTEEQGLGTPLQSSAAEGGGVTAGVRAGVAERGEWDATLFAERQSFETTVASPSADRTSERVALSQEIPADALGAAVQWTRRFLRQSGRPGPHLFTIGADVRWVDGESRETDTDPAGARRARRAGGREVRAGLYGQDIDTVFPWLEVIMGLRVDYWQAFDGFAEAPGDAAPSRRAVDTSSAVALSHRSGVRVRPTDEVTIRVSAGEGFRPPTLYEQYATRRVRDDVTASTPRLKPERTGHGEVGLEYRAPANLTVRGVGFWHEMTNAITAVTLTGDDIPLACATATTCRRRLNLDRTRVLGTELEAEVVFPPSWRLSAGYVFQESRIVTAPVELALEGNRVPGVPRHQLTAGVRYARPKWPRLSARLRYLGSRFEDDRNTLRLASAVIVDLSASLALGRRSEAFVAVDNVLDAVSEVGKTGDGVVTTGTPRLVRLGLRLRF